MRSLNGREFIRLIQAHGWTLLRINGRHHIYGKEGERARLSVPVHGATAFKAGLLRSLMKSAGLSEDDLT